MPTYATEADLLAAVADTAYEARIPQDTPARNRLLESAERDVDRELGVGTRDEAAVGLLWPAATIAQDLDVAQRASLSRAVCAQAVYRVEMGPEFFVRPQRDSVSRRGYSAQGKLPIVGPEAWRELTFSGLLRLTASVGGRGPQSDRDVGWHEVD